MKLKYTDLKSGIYTSPQSGDLEMERYIVENQEDLDKFLQKFPQIKMLGMYKNLKRCVEEGYIVILTDVHPMTGMPTYCFEAKADSTHPSSMYRKN